VRTQEARALFKKVFREAIWESGYLLDATSPNRLWFSQLGKCNWFNLNGLLDQSVEQLAA
jgi:hypothetical protein